MCEAGRCCPLLLLLRQVGESAQILSGCRLHAPLHCVLRGTSSPRATPAGPSPRQATSEGPTFPQVTTEGGPASEDLSRQSFVVFVQPAWGAVLDSPLAPVQDEHSPSCVGGNSSGGCVVDGYSLGSSTLNSGAFQEEELQFGHASVPKLKCRWQPGMTFSEFAKATTRAYYGAGGLQPNRT